MKKNRGHAWRNRKRRLLAKKVRNIIERGASARVYDTDYGKPYVAFVHPSLEEDLRELLVRVPK